MIRPLTLICMLLACGSGLYLYQTKHRVQMLDREIAQTVQATMAARDRAGVLRTEWTLLNDLERLRALSDQYLQLRPVAPSQFTTFAELGNRLPAPRAPQPEPAASPALVSDNAPVPADEADTEAADLPTPPVPPGVPPAAAPSAAPAQPQVASQQTPAAAKEVAAREASREAAREASIKAAQKATAEAAAARAAERRQLAELSRAQPAPRPVATAPASPGSATTYSAPRPYNAPQTYSSPATYNPPPTSSLGMASRTSLPPPVPVSAYQSQFASPN